MNKYGIPLTLLFTLIFLSSIAYAAFPFDAVWKLPAKYRLIYEINTAGLTDGNVYVEFNIPDYVYTHLVTRLQNGELCGTIENNRLPDELWPVLFYASTANNTQRYIPFPNYTINAYYTYTTACTDVNGVPYVAKFPKTIMVHIPALDGDANFTNYQHYLFVYEPFLFFDTGSFTVGYFNAFGWLGDPMIAGDYGDTLALYTTTFSVKRVFELNVPLSSYSQVFLRGSITRFGLKTSISVSFITSDGKRIVVVFGDNETPLQYDILKVYNSSRISNFNDVKRLVSESTGIPYTDFMELEAIAYIAKTVYGVTPYYAKIDDVYLFIS